VTGHPGREWADVVLYVLPASTGQRGPSSHSAGANGPARSTGSAATLAARGMTLLLEVTEYGDAAHWLWRLTTEGGAFIADHQVALDTNAVEYQGFVDLHGFLWQRANPGRRLARQAELVDRVGGWLGREALGSIGPALVERSPVMVRVRVPPERKVPEREAPADRITNMPTPAPTSAVAPTIAVAIAP
jgi:hypothetical protein